jgi:putative nucleotidyltransferase with HDIG domain
MDKVDRYIEQVPHFPPAPAVVTQLLGLFGDTNRDADRLAELISYDPSLTGEVMKRCNSAFFRGAEPTPDVFAAVTRLGFNEVHSVVMTLSGASAVSRARIEGALDAGSLWRHSLRTTMAAGAVAHQLREPEGVASTAGLLHDVGKLVFAAVEGAAYAELMRRADASRSALAHAEEAGLGVTHAEAGARLLARWGLPESIVHAVRYHHDSPAAAVPYERLAATVHLANYLAHRMTGGEAPALDPAAADPEAVSLLQLTAEDVSEVMERAEQRLQQAQEVLQIAV